MKNRFSSISRKEWLVAALLCCAANISVWIWIAHADWSPAVSFSSLLLFVLVMPVLTILDLPGRLISGVAYTSKINGLFFLIHPLIFIPLLAIVMSKWRERKERFSGFKETIPAPSLSPEERFQKGE